MKRKEITVQSLTVERITFSRRRRKSDLPPTCDICHKPVKWLNLAELHERFDVELTALFAAFETGKMHIALGPRGTLYVCESSAAVRFGAVSD